VFNLLKYQVGERFKILNLAVSIISLSVMMK